MENYRLLTDEEILLLEDNGCTAENWTSIKVSEYFNPAYVNNVRFYGEVNLGTFETCMEVSPGFIRHSGVRNATLRNTTIGDNCLIENIGNYINNYVIGEECFISNVCTMETTDGATFGEGAVIPVLNEAGSGNVIIFCGLTACLAALMVKYSHDKEFTSILRRQVREDIALRICDCGTIGNRVKIINTTEITNTNISDDCEINGACRLSDCTITADYENNVYIGSGVICENSIIADGSAVLNSAKINSCYVGECCTITNGFTAENSLFFVNCYLSNGEACAAFCGPFSNSHHKSSLLIGGMFSFYNAGSATNFSNHAYKIGPVHYGILERGSKTASGSYILMPAQIGAFSVCIGKISNHPNTTAMPFSYVIAEGRDTYLVPAKNLVTVGLYRDVKKWQRRDRRPFNGKKSAVNYEWLNPMTINEITKAINVLNNLKDLSDQKNPFYVFNNCKISKNSLLHGIEYYTMAVQMFLADTLKDKSCDYINSTIKNSKEGNGNEEWVDLLGLLLPQSEERNIVEGVKNNKTNSVQELIYCLNACNNSYEDWLLNYAVKYVCKWLNLEKITEDELDFIEEQGIKAKQKWIDAIKYDAKKEFDMGDVEQELFDKFIAQLNSESEE